MQLSEESLLSDDAQVKFYTDFFSSKILVMVFNHVSSHLTDQNCSIIIIQVYCNPDESSIKPY